jgi:hypothetical protein
MHIKYGVMAQVFPSGIASRRPLIVEQHPEKRPKQKLPP